MSASVEIDRVIHQSASVRFDLPLPTTRRGLTTVTLTPGVIDDDVVEVFAYGYCYLLACVLHEISGWPFGFVETYHPSSGQWQLAHACVIAPDGRLVDVGGRWDFSGELIDRHGVPLAARLRRVEDFAEARDIFHPTGIPDYPDYRIIRSSNPDLAKALHRLAGVLVSGV
jgi:hypothetical protein